LAALLAADPRSFTLASPDAFDATEVGETFKKGSAQGSATLRFVEERSNVRADRTPGVGKTMLAVALARAAVESGCRGYYTTAADLVARTSKAAAEGRWQATMRFWAGPGVLVVDELGYLPLPGEAASHLLPGRQPPLRAGSIILTTNRGIAEWGRSSRTRPSPRRSSTASFITARWSRSRRELSDARPSGAARSAA
jgi:DNA replication protein